MIRVDLNVPLGAPIYGKPKKCIWPAIIGAVGAIAGGAISSSMQQSGTSYNMAKQHRYNEEEMAYSQALNKQYQNYLNNTMYGAQVGGLKNAGINPAGASSSIGAIQGHSGPSTGSSGPSAGMPNVDVVGAAAQAEQAAADVRLKDSQADLNKANADLARKDINSYGDRLAADLDKIASESERNRKQSMLYGKQSSKTEQETENLKAEGDRIAADTDRIREDIDRIRADKELTREQKATWRSYIGSVVRSNLASANYHDTQASLELQGALFDWTTATSQADAADAQTRLNNVIMRLTDRYGDAEKIVGMISDIVGIAKDAAFDIMLFKGLGGAAKSGAKVASAGIKKLYPNRRYKFPTYTE